MGKRILQVFLVAQVNVSIYGQYDFTIPMETNLSTKEEEVLKFIREYLKMERTYPTYREIQNRLHLKSINSISQYIKQLEYKGVLQIMKFRGYRLYPTLKDEEELIILQVCGQVQAGLPTDSGQNDGSIQVPKGFVKNPEISFVLNVRGNSMIEAGIHEGDTVIVERRPKAFNGDIVVALVNGENTVKRYIRKEDGSRYLKAENPLFEDILPEGDWVLQGIVIGLWRKYQ